MWIFLSDAFLSVVAHRTKAGHFMVRARYAGDLERVFPHAHVSTTPAADYRFRVVVPKKLVVAAMKKALERIDYSNFKSSVAPGPRLSAYMQVWDVMERSQQLQVGDRPRLPLADDFLDPQPGDLDEWPDGHGLAADFVGLLQW